MMYDKNKISDADEAKAIRIEKKDAEVAEKNITAEIAACVAAADDNGTEDNLEDLLNGNITTTPTRSERINSLLRSKQKVSNYIDKLSGNLKTEDAKAAMKYAAEIKSQVDGLEKEIVDAAVVLHKLHLKHFQAKRSFLNNSIGTYGNFSLSIDDVLGIPVNNHTRLYARTPPRTSAY
jgi:hypothetical protein